MIFETPQITNSPISEFDSQGVVNSLLVGCGKLSWVCAEKGVPILSWSVLSG
jgi:hypothetical protein